MPAKGIEWVRKYNGRGSDLVNTKAQAEGFYSTLPAVAAFNWGDDMAWDQDFEEKGKGSPAEGTDTTWADAVDIVFFSGHGGPGALFFGVTRDDAAARSTEILWGKTLSWIALDACNALQSETSGAVFDRWRASMAGIHIILGFHTTCRDESQRGTLLASYLNGGSTFREAWRLTCEETEEAATQWAMLGADQAGTNTYSDHWFGKGFVSPNPTQPTSRWYIKGAC